MEEKKNAGCLSVFLPFLLVCFAVVMAAWLLNRTDASPRPENESNTLIPITLRQETTTRAPAETTTRTAGETTTRPAGETTTEAGEQKPAAEEKYHYRQLNETEKDIYNRVRDAVTAGKTSLTMNNIDAKTYVAALEKGIYAFVRDYPLYFWLREGYNSTYITRSGINNDTINLDLVCFAFWNSGMNTQKYQNELQAKVQEIAALAEKQGSDYEKALFVHDYLVTHTEYDTEGYEASKKEPYDAKYDYIFTAYGCLINNSCVCEGYAKAYKLILETLGIESVFVSGKGKGEAHAWNLILLDGDYYWVDVTWDDLGTKDWPNEAKHTYFCMNTAQISVTHTAETARFTVPDCTATKYNYYVYNDLMLTSASAAEMTQLLNRAPGTKLLEFGFTAAAKATAESVSNRGNLADVQRIADAEQYWYMIDDENLAVLIYVK